MREGRVVNGRVEVLGVVNLSTATRSPHPDGSSTEIQRRIAATDGDERVRHMLRAPPFYRCNIIKGDYILVPATRKGPLCLRRTSSFAAGMRQSSKKDAMCSMPSCVTRSPKFRSSESSSFQKILRPFPNTVSTRFFLWRSRWLRPCCGLLLVMGLRRPTRRPLQYSTNGRKEHLAA